MLNVSVLKLNPEWMKNHSCGSLYGNRIKMLFLIILSIFTWATGADWTRCLGIGIPIQNIEACGKMLYATSYNDEIYISDNSGRSWAAFNYKEYDFSELVASRDCKYIIRNGTIYRSFCADTAWESILQMSAPRFLKVNDSGLYFLQHDTIFSANLDGSDLRPVTPKLPIKIIDYDFLGSTVYVLGESYTDSSGADHERNIHCYRKGATAWSALTDYQFPDHITTMRVFAGRLFAGRMNGLLIWSEADSLLNYLSNTENQSWVKKLYNINGKLIIVGWDPVYFNDSALQAENLDKAMFLNNKRKNETVDITAGDSALFVLDNTINDGMVEAYGYPYIGNEIDWDKEYVLFKSSIIGPRSTVEKVIFDGSSLLAFSGTDGVLKSSDSGVTWTQINPLTFGNFLTATMFRSKLFVVTNTEVFLSKNGGVNWEKIDLPSATSGTILDVFFTKTYAFLTTTKGFCYTDDPTGEKWNHVEQYAQQSGSAAINGKNVWFFRNDSVPVIKHSPDGGATWNTVFQGSALELFMRICADEKGVYVFSNKKGILYSGNDGVTWHTRNTGISDSLHIYSMLSYGHSSFLTTKKDSSWGDGWSASRGEVFTWSDSAGSWLKVPVPMEQNSYALLHPLGPYILAEARASGSYNEMFLSSDTGKQWVSLGAINSKEPPQQISHCFTNAELLVCATNGLWRHIIANPVKYYTQVESRHKFLPQPTVKFSFKGNEILFPLPARTTKPPVLVIYTVNGQCRTILRPKVVQNSYSMAVFSLNRLPHGLYVWRLFVDGKELRNGKFVFKN